MQERPRTTDQAAKRTVTTTVALLRTELTLLLHNSTARGTAIAIPLLLVASGADRTTHR